MIYFCAQSNRRELALGPLGLNGLDYLEVLGEPGLGTQLALTFLKDARPLALTAANISLSGGAEVQVQALDAPSEEDPTVIVVELDHSGDFSPYTLTLVAAPGVNDAPAGIDPQLASVGFSFKAGCPTPADCLTETCCPTALASAPDINYLAKDYEGFRQLMLDRLATLVPTWGETHAADIGVAITEALAYAADHLSYQQDGVSTEAYIGTARSRISLRRHARLVEYRIGEGCNARTFVHVTTTVDGLPLPSGTQFYTSVPGLGPATRAEEPGARQLLAASASAFTSLEEGTLFLAHNQIDFYTWGGSECCLPSGATSATLHGSLTGLKVGEVLIFEEVLGPKTGDTADADPSHRCAVCLSEVVLIDHAGAPLVDPVTGQAITQISWAPADALPFALCISSLTEAAPGSQLLSGVSVARGNIVPADHGTWLASPEGLPTVPPPPPAPEAHCGCGCGGATSAAAIVLPRYYPSLGRSPLTFSAPFTGIASASVFLAASNEVALPQISLHDDQGHEWLAHRDLLGAGPLERVFVPEIEQDGTAFLRFGDDVHGMAAAAGLGFAARYRIGNGSAGNIGRDTLAHALLPAAYVPPLAGIQAVRNPLAAVGGTDPEDNEHIRQFAPFAYTSQLRCVTEADYEQAAKSIGGVQDARGTLRWTGSWHTAFVSIDPSQAQLTDALMREAGSLLELRRMMGVDLALEGAVIVGLRIELGICVDAAHFRGDVYDALLRLFVSGDQGDGRPGLLDASNFSFGQTVYASPLIAAAQSVEGVASASLLTFTRMDAPWVDGVGEGAITMGRLDIPRCDNDPDHLDHGSLTLLMDGGR